MGLAVALLLFVLFVLDLSIGIPFHRASMLADIGFVVSSLGLVTGLVASARIGSYVAPFVRVSGPMSGPAPSLEPKVSCVFVHRFTILGFYRILGKTLQKFKIAKLQKIKNCKIQKV